MRRLILILVAIVLFACGDDTLPVTLEGMAGSWQATEIRYVDQDDRTHSRNIIGSLPSDVITLEIGSDGRVIFADRLSSFVDTSFVTLMGGDVINWQGLRYEVALSSNTMIWAGLFTLSFDIDLDGTDNDTFIQYRWVRS